GLPLPLRADGPARTAPEVPRLGARRALVPDQPARPDGRLLPHVRRHLRPGVRTRLSAVPARRPRRVGVLQPGRRQRRAVAAGPGRARAQGALSARDHPGVGRDRAARHVPRAARAARPGDARDPRHRGHRVVAAAARAGLPIRVHPRGRARGQHPARVLSRRRADPLRRAAAVVLRLADLLSARVDHRAGDGALRARVGQPGGAVHRRDPRRDLRRDRARRGGACLRRRRRGARAARRPRAVCAPAGRAGGGRV
ncbi:MAG: hypothetical protein AVDCRST_MAG67-851, partial [uncultured Solirubrobacteraceae bacterium]